MSEWEAGLAWRASYELGQPRDRQNDKRFIPSQNQTRRKQQMSSGNPDGIAQCFSGRLRHVV